MPPPHPRSCLGTSVAPTVSPHQTGGVEFTYFDKATETLPRSDLQSIQLAKLRKLIEAINGPNRFYTAKFDQSDFTVDRLRTLEDLRRLPFTTKAELLEAQEDSSQLSTNATFPELAYTRFHQTSGTTGVPLRVFDTPSSWDWWAHCWGFVLAGAGVTAEDRLFMPFSFGPFIGFWAAVDGAKKIGAMMVPGGGRGSLERLHLMRDLQVTVMCSTPTYALHLAEVAREHSFDLAEIPMRITVHAGEPGASVPATKARIESLWNARCFDHAGASEVGAFSFECQAQPGGTHVIDNEFVIEVIDPTSGDLVEAGAEGELVITNLGRAGFPILRYRTGDLVKVDESPCSCGRTFTRLAGGVIGRADDLVIVRGVNIFPAGVENLIRRHAGIDEFRVTISRQAEMLELIIEVECAEGVDGEGTCQAIAGDFQATIGLRPEIHEVPRQSLPRFELKARRFIVE